MQLRWRKTIEAPEFLFFSALANTMRKEGLTQQDFAGKALWKAYTTFLSAEKQLHLKFHFLRITLPCMCSGRTASGKFIFHADFLANKLGDEYSETAILI
jgi:hypothetical protein